LPFLFLLQLIFAIEIAIEIAIETIASKYS
jgi:hypothetical protein